MIVMLHRCVQEPRYHSCKLETGKSIRPVKKSCLGLQDVPVRFFEASMHSGVAADLTMRHDSICASEPKPGLVFLEVIEQHTSCKAQVLEVRLVGCTGYVCWKDLARTRY